VFIAWLFWTGSNIAAGSMADQLVRLRSRHPTDIDATDDVSDIEGSDDEFAELVTRLMVLRRKRNFSDDQKAYLAALIK